MEKEFTILIVEDEKTIQEALVFKFKKEGFNVLKASDGEEALKIALENKIDMILLDIILPKMDGVTMLKKLREDKRGLDTPVILLTNLDYSVGVAKMMEAGAFDYLVKTDWTLDEVVEKVREKLRG